jgi:hypothetical protein
VGILKAQPVILLDGRCDPLAERLARPDRFLNLLA